MERTKGEKGEKGQIRYKKIGGGSYRLGSRIIKPNQIFHAFPDEISEAFKDIVVPVDTLSAEEVEKVKGIKTEYSLKSRGGGWYDVVDGQDKVLNEKALKRDAALKLIKDLEG